MIERIFRIIKQDGIGGGHMQLLLVKAAVAGCPDGAIGCIEPKTTGITGFIISLTRSGKIVLPVVVSECQPYRNLPYPKCIANEMTERRQALNFHQGVDIN